MTIQQQQNYSINITKMLFIFVDFNVYKNI